MPGTFVRNESLFSDNFFLKRIFLKKKKKMLFSFPGMKAESVQLLERGIGNGFFPLVFVSSYLICPLS